MTICVQLVDDHTVVRAGLMALLGEESDIRVIAEAGSGQEALALINESVPDVVVMDLNLPDMGGVQVTRRILAQHPEIRVLVLSMDLDETCVVESLDAGARGYLVKDCAAEELVTAIRTIYQGKPYFCLGAQEIMLKKCRSDDARSSEEPVLTKRETEVLKWTAKGLSIKQIALKLDVSNKMIEVHRTNARKKLKLYSIAELTTYALKKGLV